MRTSARWGDNNVYAQAESPDEALSSPSTFASTVCKGVTAAGLRSVAHANTTVILCRRVWNAQLCSTRSKGLCSFLPS